MFEEQQTARKRDASLSESLTEINRSTKKILALIFLLTFGALFIVGIVLSMTTSNEEEQMVAYIFMGVSVFSIVVVLVPILLFWKPTTQNKDLDYIKKKALSYTGNQNNPYATIYVVETLREDITRLETKIDELHQEIKKMSR